MSAVAQWTIQGINATVSPVQALHVSGLCAQLAPGNPKPHVSRGANGQRGLSDGSLVGRAAVIPDAEDIKARLQDALGP